MGAFDDMYMCSDCGIVTVPRFDPHECKMPTGVARTFKGALDRERWLRFCDAWVAIGLAESLVRDRCSRVGGWPGSHRDMLGRLLLGPDWYRIPAAEAK